MTQQTVEDVRKFWDSNPLMTGELSEAPGSVEFFREFDRIKMDLFLGDLSDWFPADLRSEKVLDIGCGPGFWHRRLGRGNVDYFGIDISPRTLELTKTSQQIFKLQGTLKVGNAEKLDFADNTFDRVISEGVIHHTPDTESCVREIYRVLKPGGKATIGVYYKGFLLRSPFLFKLTQRIMKIFGVSLKGRGREKMYDASDSSEFVRMYDGADNPVGKAYSRKELAQMFSKFDQHRFKRYYFPHRALPIQFPKTIQKIINSLCGTMILIQAVKPKN